MSVDTPEAHRPTELASGSARTAPPSDAPRPSLGGSFPLGEIIGERYRLVAHVGSGGQGEVWRAEDIAIAGHVVALKMLHARAQTDADRDAQLRELRMLATVSHPAVVQFKDHGWMGGRLWFVMPWYEGRTLESAAPLTRTEARRVFETLAAGLAAVHAKGLRHQDIKPSNVFLARIDGLEGTMPVLLDFGVAAGEGELLVAGSPDYFAPELAADWPAPLGIGPEADVFALALSLRNVLDPATAPSLDAFDRASLSKRANERIAPPRGRELAYLAPHFERWLALAPEKRPTAAELLRELAVLTEPEDARKERSRLVKKFAPWALGVTLVGSLGAYWGYEQLVVARKAAAAEAIERQEAEAQARAESERAENLGDQLETALARADASSRRTSEALTRLDEAEAAIGQAAGNVERLRDARDRLRAALEEARTEIAGLETALGDTQSAMARVTGQLQSTQAQLQSAQAQLQTTQGQLQTTQGQLQSSQAQLQSSQAQLQTTQAQLQTTQAQLQTTQAQLQTTQAQLDQTRTELDAQRARTSTAESERDAARQETQAARQETQAARQEAQAAAQARIDALEAQVAELRRRLAAAESSASGTNGTSGTGATGDATGATP